MIRHVLNTIASRQDDQTITQPARLFPIQSVE